MKKLAYLVVLIMIVGGIADAGPLGLFGKKKGGRCDGRHTILVRGEASGGGATKVAPPTLVRESSDGGTELITPLETQVRQGNESVGSGETTELRRRLRIRGRRR